MIRESNRLDISFLPVRESVFSKDENHHQKTKQLPLIVRQLNGYNIWILANYLSNKRPTLAPGFSQDAEDTVFRRFGNGRAILVCFGNDCEP
jgi:hypothetical protein